MMMIPSVIREDLVNPFKYWNDGIRDGMNLSGELYAHVRSYANESRLEAYQLGCELAEKGMQVCLTCSSSRYAVWINLKSAALANEENASVPAVSY